MEKLPDDVLKGVSLGHLNIWRLCQSKPLEYEVRPDRKGPKNIAVLLFLEFVLVLVHGYDLQASIGLDSPMGRWTRSLPPQTAQGGEPTTVEQYRDFEADVRENHAFLIRAVSSRLTQVACSLAPRCSIVFSEQGAYLCTGGALSGSAGVGASFINNAAQEHLQEAMKLTYEIWVYLCGAMGLCLAVAALPLLERSCQTGTPTVRLVVHEEE